MTNQLAGESSRYLQQHADNPVNWYPWGEAAFDKARTEDKPIFLSIGYSACHWCHVMAHESFEDEETAAILNNHFVSIKVDREERPDLDRIYMGAVQAMTGGGGWPMSVFITPEGKPFYGGTYFPKESRYNMPSFRQVLEAIAEAWKERRDELLEGSQNVMDVVERRQAIPGEGAGGEGLRSDIIEGAYRNLRQDSDRASGGWGHAPKFPQPMVLEFLLRYYRTTGDGRALGMVTETLTSMAHGGIYDQLGGGFHRYAVDAYWVVPHFEKMLYDNAQLARIYLHAWQVTENPLFRAVAQETLDYVAREMTSPEGGFYSTQDADTEGEEGKFYIWTPDEIRDLLGDDAEAFMEFYGVTEQGNFEGENILTFDGTYEQRAAMAKAREVLFEARAERTRPGRDKKVLASWNGLMLAAFAEAARVLDRDDYRDVAEDNADFLLQELRTSEGRLYHAWADGKAKVEGFLEDYTHVIEGLLALYQTTFEPRWYEAAAAMGDVILAHFTAEGGAEGPVGFYDTADDGEDLVVRPRELQDNAVPSGSAMAATVLLKLAHYAGDLSYDAQARRSIAPLQATLAQHPLGFGQWLIAMDHALSTPVEVAIIGDPKADPVQALIATAQSGYHPHRLLAAGTGDVPSLLAHREQIEGKPTVYVCRNHVCRAPVTTREALKEQLA